MTFDVIWYLRYHELSSGDPATLIQVRESDYVTVQIGIVAVLSSSF